MTGRPDAPDLVHILLVAVGAGSREEGRKAVLAYSQFFTRIMHNGESPADAHLDSTRNGLPTTMDTPSRYKQRAAPTAASAAPVLPAKVKGEGGKLRGTFVQKVKSRRKRRAKGDFIPADTSISELVIVKSNAEYLRLVSVARGHARCLVSHACSRKERACHACSRKVRSCVCVYVCVRALVRSCGVRSVKRSRRRTTPLNAPSHASSGTRCTESTRRPRPSCARPPKQ
jgi:hypothetical protein